MEQMALFEREQRPRSRSLWPDEYPTPGEPRRKPTPEEMQAYRWDLYRLMRQYFQVATRSKPTGKYPGMAPAGGFPPGDSGMRPWTAEEAARSLAELDRMFPECAARFAQVFRTEHLAGRAGPEPRTTP